MNEQFGIGEDERRDEDDNAKFRGSWRAVARDAGDASLRTDVAKRAEVQLRRDGEDGDRSQGGE